MSARRFDFAFDPAYRRAALPFGVVPARAWVDVGETMLEARYGPWHVATPIANIKGAEITGPYARVKTAGPARLGFTDRGLTFASNGERGVLITFVRKVRGIEPTGLLRHPELTVTVADVAALTTLLNERRARA
jgi:hypothetical protein